MEIGVQIRGAVLGILCLQNLRLRRCALGRITENDVNVEEMRAFMLPMNGAFSVLGVPT